MDKGRKKKYHPVEFAAVLHKKFVFIHPFKDGNGRVARLLMNTALIQDGYLPALIPPILRSEYIALLEKAHEDDSPFINFIIERELESQRIFYIFFIYPCLSYSKIIYLALTVWTITRDYSKI